jgi:hypothetical protein
VKKLGAIELVGSISVEAMVGGVERRKGEEEGEEGKEGKERKGKYEPGVGNYRSTGSLR